MIDIAIEWGISEQSFHFGWGYLLVVGTFLHLPLIGDLTECLVHLFLQLAHTALTGIALDDHLDGRLRECGFHALHVQTCILQLAGYQVALGDFYLLLGGIARHLDNLHAVEQGSGNGA